MGNRDWAFYEAVKIGSGQVDAGEKNSQAMIVDLGQQA
jgi:hypothetical protein